MIKVIGPSAISPDLTEVRTMFCQGCGQDTLLHLPTEPLRLYLGGAFVQDAFPSLSVDDREMIISGTHPECWDAIFGSEDE